MLMCCRGQHRQDIANKIYLVEKHNCLNFGLYTLVISIVCPKAGKVVLRTQSPANL